MANWKVATVRAESKLEGPGRSIIEARGQSFRLDAPPLIHGPNEVVNPVEAFVGTLASCGVLFLQHLADTMDIALEDIRTEVEGDFDPAGVKGEGPDPALSAIRLRYEIRSGEGTSANDVKRLIEAFRARCPVHRTLSKAVEIQEKIDMTM